MSRKTMLVHRHCGGRVVEDDEGSRHCMRCHKDYLLGDSVDRISLKTGKKVAGGY